MWKLVYYYHFPTRSWMHRCNKMGAQPEQLAIISFKDENCFLWPAKLCSVVPPMWHAATPVLAVAKVLFGGRDPRILFSRKDFPVPGEKTQYLKHRSQGVKVRFSRALEKTFREDCTFYQHFQWRRRSCRSAPHWEQQPALCWASVSGETRWISYWGFPSPVIATKTSDEFLKPRWLYRNHLEIDLRSRVSEL